MVLYLIKLDLLDADLADAETANTYSLISKLKYPFNLKEDEGLAKTLYHRHYEGTRNWLKDKGGALVPQTLECCDTECWVIDAPRRAKRQCLFSLNGFIDVTVANTYCSVCHRHYEYDGRADGIVNFGNSKLFCVELMMELLEFKLNGGVPTQTYWKSKLNSIALTHWSAAERQARFEQCQKEWHGISGKLNEMMTCFIRLIDYGPKIFKCCTNPKVLCIDGIVLSVENSRIERRNSVSYTHLRAHET
jgi:hypothetical protein